jgi:glutamate-5-semialdehyde dehydrogenase
MTLEVLMLDIGRRARTVAGFLSLATCEQKNAALNAMAAALIRNCDAILAANSQDMQNGEDAGLSTSVLDRLFLDQPRVESMARSLIEILQLKDPIGETIAQWDRPNGLSIERVRTPLGVIGVIYESRPNVTADAGGLCLKAGNPVILRGGSDSVHSSHAIHASMIEGLVEAGFPPDSIQLVPSTDRACVGEMLTGLNGTIDVIVPRGGRSLVERVQKDARVPVFAHLEGICHVYVDESADVDMARSIVKNAKMRRTGVCGALECLLIDQAFYDQYGAPMISDLIEMGCEVRTKGILQSISGTIEAQESDFGHEFLDKIIVVTLVNGISDAIEHINTYSSHHTEAVIAENSSVVSRFFNEIDSAILLHNASTQFADGGEFGMGAEIGIATGKMHARGPVGVEQLTSFKYKVRGTGQIRP